MIDPRTQNEDDTSDRNYHARTRDATPANTGSAANVDTTPLDAPLVLAPVALAEAELPVTETDDPDAVFEAMVFEEPAAGVEDPAAVAPSTMKPLMVSDSTMVVEKAASMTVQTAIPSENVQDSPI